MLNLRLAKSLYSKAVLKSLANSCRETFFSVRFFWPNAGVASAASAYSSLLPFFSKSNLASFSLILLSDSLCSPSFSVTTSKFYMSVATGLVFSYFLPFLWSLCSLKNRISFLSMVVLNKTAWMENCKYNYGNVPTSNAFGTLPNLLPLFLLSFSFIRSRENYRLDRKLRLLGSSSTKGEPF